MEGTSLPEDHPSSASNDMEKVHNLFMLYGLTLERADAGWTIKTSLGWYLTRPHTTEVMNLRFTFPLVVYHYALVEWAASGRFDIAGAIHDSVING